MIGFILFLLFMMFLLLLLGKGVDNSSKESYKQSMDNYLKTSISDKSENLIRKRISNYANIGEVAFSTDTNKMYHIKIEITFAGKVKKIEHEEYDLEKVISTELLVNNKTISITKSKGGVGRAVIGGALFGPAGAVVGASTSTNETKTTNNEEYSVRTVFNDMQNPIISFNFANQKKEAEETYALIKIAIENKSL